MGKASRLRKERQNRETAKGYSSPRKDKNDKISMPVKDDLTICNSRGVHKVLEEKREGGKKMKGKRKEVDSNSRKDITGLQQSLNDSVKQYSFRFRSAV